MLSRIVLLLFMFSVVLSSLSGQETVFYYIADELQDTEAGAEELFQKGQHILYSDPAQAREYAAAALEALTPDDNPVLRLQILNFTGISYMIQSAYDNALQYFHDAAREAQEQNNPLQMSNSYNNIAVVHSDMGNYKDALHYYMQALDGYEKAAKPDSRAAVYTNMGKIYAEIDNRSKALENFHAALEIFTEKQDSIRMGTVYVSLSDFYLKTQRPDSAMIYADKALFYKKETMDKYGLCSALEIKARVYNAEGNFTMAEEYFDRALQVAEGIEFHSGKISALLGMAEMAMELTHSDAALEYAETALSISQKIDNNKLAYRAHNLLSTIHHHMGDDTAAYRHFTAYYRLKNESINQSRLHQVYNLELERAAEKSMREIERREQLLGQKNTTIFLISIAFALILIILGLLYYIHFNRQKQKDKKQKDEALLRLTEERASASLKAEISERRRLGMELHDGASPLISLARMNLGALLEKTDISPHRKTTLLGNTMETLDQLLEELKSISQNMTSSILDEQGLEAAIENLVGGINENTRYIAHAEITGLNGSLETFVEHAIFRAVQEAVNNILVHAGATIIHIQVTGSKEDLTIMIEDNGQGFDPETTEKHKGMGLKSIASRIEGLRGEFFIDSVKGRGTIVTMIIPLN
ncbi:MAG: hypothetical protein EA361_18405 [Bacteroidetes bacterium]|nr:MAG: hypothetical protein EA361_18405 [Bacteroidota bacterium]